MQIQIRSAVSDRFLCLVLGRRPNPAYLQCSFRHVLSFAYPG